MCEPPRSSVHAVYKLRGLSQGAQAPGGRHSLLWSLGGWGGKCGMWGARPRRTPAAAFRRRHGGAAGERTTGGLLSAEHTEFTWNQKTWEDKLIQVEAILPPEAGVGGNGGSSRWVWRVGSLGAPREHVPLLPEDLGSTNSYSRRPHPGNQEPRRRPRGPPLSSPQAHTALALGRG